MAVGDLGLQTTPYTGLLVVSAVLATVLTAVLWRQRPKPGATPVAAATAIAACWGYGQALLVSAGTRETALVGLYLTMVALAFIAPVWMVFALQYTGRRDRVGRRTLAVLAVEPVTFLAVLATNDAHGLVFGVVGFDPSAGATALTYREEIAYLLHYGYEYLLLVWANGLLFEKFLASRNVYRKRTSLLVLVSVLPSGAHALSVAGLSPLPYTTLGPVIFLVFSVVSLLVLVSDRFLALLPVERVLAPLGSYSKSLSPMARETAIERLRTGFVVLDHKNRIVDINPMGRRMLGQENTRVVGKELTDVVSEEMFEGLDVTLLDPGVTGEYRGIWIRTPTGEQRCFDVTLTPLETGGGFAGRVALVHDVTERERRKQELERQNDQLEDFASVVSHDLRNPLNVAAGHLELLDDDENREHVSGARRALFRMESLVDDLLALARTGQSISESTRVDLGEVATEAWQTVDTGDATLRLELDLRVEGDPERLRQVFENLFRNAVEHGGTDVTVTVGELADGFYVADDGPGIPPDQRERVFEDGFTTRQDGTGFGLSIVQTIVDAHGWKITVVDGQDGGARFEITGVGTVRELSTATDG